MDLPTLNSILLDCDIRSNNTSRQFNDLYKKLTINKIIIFFERCFEQMLFDKLIQLSDKHRSCLSRELVSVVLDESVFRQWLSSFPAGETFCNCYGSFFSGQYKRTVYGFKNSCLGLVIDGIYYPLYFDYVQKRPKKAKNSACKEESVKQSSATITTAIHLVERFGVLKRQFETEGINLGKLHVTVDKGYNDTTFINCCNQNELIYIGVVTKSHLLKIDGLKIKLRDWVQQVFLPLEEIHNEGQKHLPKEEQEPFVYRFRADYYSKKQTFTFLAFRLKDSKKVSVIFSTAKNIFAKTLRRHWFQRTYIEQFFKIIKHVLKIQESRTNDKDAFTFKFLRFVFMAFHIQQLVRFLRKKLKRFRKKGIISIQRIVRSEPDFQYLLQQIAYSKY